jgi:hypothetical protein
LFGSIASMRSWIGATSKFAGRRMSVPMCWSMGRANSPKSRLRRILRRHAAKLRSVFRPVPSEKRCSLARCTGACDRRPETSSFPSWSPRGHGSAADAAAPPRNAD